MNEPWPPLPPVGEGEYGDREWDGDRGYEHHHHHVAHQYVHQDYGAYGHRDRGMELRDQVRSQYGRGVSVGDILSFLDYRVNEIYEAILAPERHPSRVPGSPVRMAGIDAVLNADAASFRAVTELHERMDRLEQKLDQVLARLPEPPR